METTSNPKNSKKDNSFADCVAQSVGKCTDAFEDRLNKKIDDKLKGLGNNDEKFAELERKLKLLVPPGTIQAFGYPKASEGWLPCDGAAVSRAKYPDLFERIGTQFGEGDGSETFNVPDLRGLFLRGHPGGNYDPGREFGSIQGDAIRDIQGAFGKNVAPSGTIFEARSASGAFESDREVETYKALASVDDMKATGGIKYPLGYKFRAGNMVPVADENRPVNISLLFCIKT